MRWCVRGSASGAASCVLGDGGATLERKGSPICVHRVQYVHARLTRYSQFSDRLHALYALYTFSGISMTTEDVWVQITSLESPRVGDTIEEVAAQEEVRLQKLMTRSENACYDGSRSRSGFGF